MNEGRARMTHNTYFDRIIEKETKKSISKIMNAVEMYTNYPELEGIQKSLVRDTILNQINRLVRITRNHNTIIFSNSISEE